MSLSDRRGLEIGKTVGLSRKVTQRDVEKFAEVTGDDRRIHLDPDTAESTSYGGCIVQEMLISGIVLSAITELGDYIITTIEVDLDFIGELYVGDTISVEVVVEERLDNGSYLIWSICKSQTTDELVIDGTVTVLIE